MKSHLKLSPTHNALHQMSQSDRTERQNTSCIMDHFLHLSGILTSLLYRSKRQELIYACLSTVCNAVKS